MEVFKTTLVIMILTACGIGLLALIFGFVKWMYWEIIEWIDKIKDHADFIKSIEEEDDEDSKDDVISMDDVIRSLDKLKKSNPDQVFIVETPHGSVSFKIGDTLIYDDPNKAIVMDSE